ncbi:MAG: hypothetical protein KDB27_18080, partial [Planctomycetales bacterium]|nr:hypothetical protein [Planctomycetales bacterium]
DFEYCVGRLDEVRATLGRLGSDFDMLRKYVEVFHPSQEQLEMTGRKIQVPAVKQLTIPVMAQMRRLVSRLRDHIELEDRATPSFLDERIVDHLLSESSGFQVLEAGMFELWRFEPWQSVFTVRPSETYFVRNVAKFAYCDSERPATRSMYSQELAEDRDPDDGDVVLVSYQYGAAAKKIA